MPDNSKSGDARSSEPDRRLLWNRIRAFFDGESEQSLRAQIEEAIDEHEEDACDEDGKGNGNGDLSQIERQMLRNLLHFSEHDADDVAVPRGEIIAISRDAKWEDMVAVFAEHGHSRVPVYADSLDHVVGMMHIKDVFSVLVSGKPPPADWTSLVRQPLYVPQARGALDVLADMRARRVHLAIVVDEYSGTDGLITIEDLVEEIVGEIEDEHDDAPVDQLVSLPDGVWEADARVELDDVAQRIDPDLARIEGQVDTLGGMAFVLAEQVPTTGTILEHHSGWRLEIIAGDARHVERLRLHPPRTMAQEEGDG